MYVSFFHGHTFVFLLGGVGLALWMRHFFSASGTIWWLFLAFGFSCFSAFLLLFFFCFFAFCFSAFPSFCFVCFSAFCYFFFSFCLFICFFVSLLVFFLVLFCFFASLLLITFFFYSAFQFCAAWSQNAVAKRRRKGRAQGIENSFNRDVLNLAWFSSLGVCKSGGMGCERGPVGHPIAIGWYGIGEHLTVDPVLTSLGRKEPRQVKWFVQMPPGFLTTSIAECTFHTPSCQLENLQDAARMYDLLCLQIQMHIFRQFFFLLLHSFFWKTNPWRLLMAFLFNFVGCLSTWLSIVCPMWCKVGSDDGSIRRCNPGSRIFDCVLWTGWSRRDCSFPWMLDIVLLNGRQEMVRWGAVYRDVQSIEYMSCSNSGPTGHVSARAPTEQKRHDRRVGWEGDQSCCWRGWKKWGAAMATSSRWPGTAGWFSECS